MKVFISADIEGTAFTTYWTRRSGISRITRRRSWR